MSDSPEQKMLELVDVKGHIDESTIADIYDRLKPVSPEFLIGSWKGGSFDTGHPVHKQLGDLKWAGKDFRSVDDVDPVMKYDEDGKRTWATEFGNARLREAKFRDVISTAMIYDNLPVIDHFRYISDKTIIGAMDNKILKEAGTYYFYLTKE